MNCRKERMTVPNLKLGKEALRIIIAHVTRGFETPYKKEVGGHLLGYSIQGGFFISRAIPYNSRYSTRSGWGTIQYYFRKKGLLLETKRLHWLGTYHSHVEIGRCASAGQSPEDKKAHLSSGRPVEMIVRITRHRMRSPKGCLGRKVMRGEASYFFDLCGYHKDQSDKIRKMTVE
jgi:hypothetical protein